jgi:hypothetical protein
MGYSRPTAVAEATWIEAEEDRTLKFRWVAWMDAG